MRYVSSYLIDSDVLITAKKPILYLFDLPGFLEEYSVWARSGHASIALTESGRNCFLDVTTTILSNG